MPDRYPVAIFHFAHAVMTTGPGAFNEEARKSTEAYLENIYRNYHGSLSGLDEVKRASTAAWIPPQGWTIQSVLTISREQREAEEKFEREHPEIVLWRNLKVDDYRLEAGRILLRLKVALRLKTPEGCTG